MLTRVRYVRRHATFPAEQDAEKADAETFGKMAAISVARMWRRNKSALAGITPLAGSGEPALLEQVLFFQQGLPIMLINLE